MLHVRARPWINIILDFLKMSIVFTYCFTLYPTIPLEDDYMICFLGLCMIVYRQSGFMFLIPDSENLTAEKCIDTLNTDFTSIISYPYYIVFD